MSDTVGIKPCPFCGGNGDTFFKKGWFTVECNDGCLAAGPMNRTEAGAIAEWNKRSPDRKSFDAGWDYHEMLAAQTETDADIAEATYKNRSALYLSKPK